MAQTPWEMAAVGKEFSDQSALFAWAAMAVLYGAEGANDPKSYKVVGHGQTKYADMLLDSGKGKPNNFLMPVSSKRLHWLKWLHAIKNQGHGDKVRGSRGKAEGVRAGVSDIMLPVARVTAIPYEFDTPGPWSGSYGAFGGSYLTPPDTAFHAYHGLYIELKRLKDGKPSDIQLEFQADVRAAGYACEVVYGWEAARDLLTRYLDL